MRNRTPAFRRVSAALAVGTGLAIALAGCSSETDGAAAESGGEASNLSGSLTIYSANPQGLTDDLIEAFESEHDVTIEVFGDTTGKITARLDAEWENPQADLVYVASWAPAAKYAEEGVMHAYTPAGAENINAGWTGPDETFHGRDGSALALVVNTDMAPATPADWDDFTASEWEGLVTMPDPRESGTARDLIAAMVSDWGKDATWDLFDDLFANGLNVEGANGPALDRVLAGSYATVLGGVDYAAYNAVNDGEPVEVILPASGTTVSPRPIFILEDSENIEAAEAFVDFMFSEEGQEISVDRNMIPARGDVPVADHMVAFEDVEQLDYSWDEIGDISSDVLDEFTERYLA